MWSTSRPGRTSATRSCPTSRWQWPPSTRGIDCRLPRASCPEVTSRPRRKRADCPKCYPRRDIMAPMNKQALKNSEGMYVRIRPIAKRFEGGKGGIELDRIDHDWIVGESLGAG